MQYSGMVSDDNEGSEAQSSDTDLAKTSAGVADPDRKELVSIRYQEAARGIEQQRGALGELRARTGLLITAATISSSFLGSTAAKGNPGFPGRFYLPVISFGISIGLALAILLPWPGWRFFLRSASFDAYEGEPADDVISALAGLLESNMDQNQKRIDSMSRVFTISAILLLISIIAWIVVIE